MILRLNTRALTIIALIIIVAIISTAFRSAEPPPLRRVSGTLSPDTARLLERPAEPCLRRSDPGCEAAAHVRGAAHACEALFACGTGPHNTRGDQAHAGTGADVPHKGVGGGVGTGGVLTLARNAHGQCVGGRLFFGGGGCP